MAKGRKLNSCGEIFEALLAGERLTCELFITDAWICYDGQNKILNTKGEVSKLSEWDFSSRDNWYIWEPAQIVNIDVTIHFDNGNLATKSFHKMNGSSYLNIKIDSIYKAIGYALHDHGLVEGLTNENGKST